MRYKVEFIVLEGVMIVIALLVLTIFRPRYCFATLATDGSHKRPKSVNEGEDIFEMNDLA